MNKEKLNTNFDINAKYEDMIQNSKEIIDRYNQTHDGSCETPNYICLAYDVKNYLSKLQKENQTNKTIIEIQVKRIYELEHTLEELKKWLEEQTDYLIEIDGQSIPLKDNFEFCSMNELYQTGKYSGFKEVLDKIKELEEGVRY